MIFKNSRKLYFLFKCTCYFNNKRCSSQRQKKLQRMEIPLMKLKNPMGMITI